MRFGEMALDLEDRAEETGIVPQALAMKPDLPKHLEIVREAFWLLSRQRGYQVGMGGLAVQPLTIVDCLALAATLGIDGIYFLRVIGPADGLYIETVNARSAKNNGPR